MEMAMIVLSFTTDLITQWMCKTGLGGRVISEEFFRALEERFKSWGPGCSKGG